MKTVTIYTDGSCSGNPGPGGFAAILKSPGHKCEEHTREITGGEPSTTNNRMELGPSRSRPGDNPRAERNELVQFTATLDRHAMRRLLLNPDDLNLPGHARLPGSRDDASIHTCTCGCADRCRRRCRQPSRA